MGSNEYSNSENEFWLFGYGSLIWKPPPHFDRRVPGYVTGYVRRFWQPAHSSSRPDHRGTPSAPGRVVTLIPYSHWLTLDDPHPIPSEVSDPKVWGTAYRILADKVEEVRNYLDIREINGYTIHYTPFYPASDETPERRESQNSIRTLVYIGTPDNAQFMGPQEPQGLAEHIFKSEGPSGLNRDYLLSLEKALDELSPGSGDEHVKDLADRVRKIGEQKRVETSQAEVVSHELKKVASTDEQEETEK